MTRKAYEKLPQEAQHRVDRFRKDMKTDQRHRELYLAKGNGYLEGLRDAGLITEMDCRMLKCYLSI